MTKNKLDESLDIIEDLLDTISWLGGDSYEQECIEGSVNKAGQFLEALRPHVPDPGSLPKTDSRLGQYQCVDQPHIIVHAVNKRHARNLCGRTPKKIKCIKAPSF